MTLVLPREAVAAIIDHVTLMGTTGGGLETGGFILGREGRASVLAIAGKADVRRARDLFVVGGRASARLFEHAEAHRQHVLCQWHSHRRQATLSRADVTHGFNVRGLHSMIVPDYARAPRDPRAWGWWLFDGQHWTTTAAAEIKTDRCGVMVFDAGGIHAA
jgi:hypothetical protein